MTSHGAPTASLGSQCLVAQPTLTCQAPNRELFSTLDLVHQCLVDDDRVNAFAKAIKRCVQPGAAVLDVGTGTGVLALLAARAGADRVWAIEFDPVVADLARQVAEDNGFEGRIKIITGDAATMKLDLPTVDVVVCELLTTGCVDEQQIPVLANLRAQRVLGHTTTVIPQRLDTSVMVAQVDFSLYGFEFRMVKHLWKQYGHQPVMRLLSGPLALSSLDFGAPTPLDFSRSVLIEVQGGGVANSLLISSEAALCDGVTITDTTACLAPVAVPLEPRPVAARDRLSLAVEYVYGGGYGNFRACWV